MLTVSHCKTHWSRFERLEMRRNWLASYALGYDAAPLGRRELWRALRNAPSDFTARYNRLCRVSALYRTAGLGDV